MKVLSYTEGIFFAKEDLDNTVFSTLTGLNGYSYYTDFVLVVQKLIGSTSDLDNETYAFYTQATYDINDWFQLTKIITRAVFPNLRMWVLQRLSKQAPEIMV